MTQEQKTKICKFILKIIGVLFLVFIALIIIGFVFKEDIKPVQKEVQTKVEDTFSKHDEWVESQFSKYDGRHIKLSVLIKTKLNDPKSFEHVETKFSKQGDDLIVFMTYRAKNSFNALVLVNVKAKVNYADDSIDIL